MYARNAVRPPGFLLLFPAGGLFFSEKPELMEYRDVLQLATLALSGVLVPVLLSFRKESREDRKEMRDGLHQLRDKIHPLGIAIARLEERDRIAEVLDKRLSKE